MILAFTGAGISKASGIPTFDERDDLRIKLDRSFAKERKEEFNHVIGTLKNICTKAKPNDAHMALVENDIPVITMNIDGLHKRALKNVEKSNSFVIEVHGNIFDNNVVLYGDSAPKYSQAYRMIRKLRQEDILLIIGTSYYTNISKEIKELAKKIGVNIIEINNNAEFLVRQCIEQNKEKLERPLDFLKREELY